MTNFLVQSSLKHNGTQYNAGSIINLDGKADKQAIAELLKIGVIINQEGVPAKTGQEPKNLGPSKPVEKGGNQKRS